MTTVSTNGRTVYAAPPEVSMAPAIGDVPTTAVMPAASAMVPAVVTPPTQAPVIAPSSTQVVVVNPPRPLAGAAPHVGISVAGLTAIAAFLSLDMAGPALVATGVTAFVQGATLLARHLMFARAGATPHSDAAKGRSDDVDAILARFAAAARATPEMGAEGAASGTSTSPETIEQLRKLCPFFAQQVEEAHRWDEWGAEAKSLRRAFSFLAERVKPLDPRLSAVITNFVDEANATSREQEKVEDVLRPAAEYITARLQRGPVDARSDLQQIGVMFARKVGEAARWDDWKAEAQSLRRAFCYTIPLVADHDAELGAFMRKSLAEADAASAWQERAEDVLRPAAAYVTRTLEGRA